MVLHAGQTAVCCGAGGGGLQNRARVDFLVGSLFMRGRVQFSSPMTPPMRTFLAIPGSRPQILAFFLVASLVALAVPGGARADHTGDQSYHQSSASTGYGPSGNCCYDGYSGQDATYGECEGGWTEADCKGGDSVGEAGMLWNGDKPLCDFMCGKRYTLYYCNPASYTCDVNAPTYQKVGDNYVDPPEIRKGYKYVNVDHASLSGAGENVITCADVCVKPTVELKAASLCTEKAVLGTVDANGIKSYAEGDVPPSAYIAFYFDLPLVGNAKQKTSPDASPHELQFAYFNIPGTRMEMEVDECLQGDWLASDFQIDNVVWLAEDHIEENGTVSFVAEAFNGQSLRPPMETELRQRVLDLPSDYAEGESHRQYFYAQVDNSNPECQPGANITSRLTITTPAGLVIQSDEVGTAVLECGCGVCEKCIVEETGLPCGMSDMGADTCMGVEPYSRYCTWTNNPDFTGEDAGENTIETRGYCLPDPDNEWCDYAYACCKRKGTSIPDLQGLQGPRPGDQNNRNTASQNSGKPPAEPSPPLSARQQSNLKAQLTSENVGVLSSRRIEYPDNDNVFLYQPRVRGVAIGGDADFAEARECAPLPVAFTSIDDVQASFTTEAAAEVAARVARIENYCAKPRSIDLWCDRRLTEMTASCDERIPDEPTQSPLLGTVMFVPPFYDERSGVTYDQSEGRTMQCGYDDKNDADGYCEMQRDVGVCCRADDCITMSVNECDPQGIILPFNDVSDEGHSTNCEAWMENDFCRAALAL